MIRRRLPIRRRPLPNRFQPDLTHVVARWTRKWVDRNYWRVRHIIDSKEDAYQECMVILSICYDRYVRHGKVNNQKWFESLYIRSVINAWNSWSRVDEQERSVVAHDVELPEVLGQSYNAGPAAVMLRELSTDARIVLETMMDAPIHVIDFILAGITGNAHHNVYNRRLLILSRQPTSAADVLKEITDLVR